MANLVAKASYKIDDGLLQGLSDQGVSEADLVKLRAFGAYTGARPVAEWTAAKTNTQAAILEGLPA